MLIFLVALAASRSAICEMCVDKVETALKMARNGASLRRVNYTILKQCENMTGFMRIGCKGYVKKYVGELYNAANNTDMSAEEICVEKHACQQDL